MSGRFELHRGKGGYPEHLRQSQRPPAVLYGIGEPASLVPGLAIIGARKATPYGLRCARIFAECAARLGVTVISGGAMGCDLEAQTAALAAGGASVAVLGCGADRDYPRRAAGTLALMRAGRGAVVSELDWGTPPRPGQFPARNRIIAGLSSAVLVVEAALPSGTFSTADFALDAGRDVLAVPGSILYAGSAGSNRLIRQGAAAITCVDDLTDALVSCGLVREADEREVADPASSIVGVDRLLDAVRAHPMLPDALTHTLGLDASTVLAGLAALEASGAIARYPDGRYGGC